MNFINARVAIKRLQKFVDSEEMEQAPSSAPPPHLPCNVGTCTCMHRTYPCMGQRGHARRPMRLQALHV